MIKSKESITSTTDEEVESTEIKPMSFDEVAAVIQSGDSKKLGEIIETGRVNDINMKSRDQFQCPALSLLMVACESGFIECVRVLLDHNANINYQTFHRTVLKSTCLSGNPAILRLIIERGYIITDISVSEVVGSMVVSNTELSTILVGSIMDVNWLEGSLLSGASRVGNVTIVKMLLDRGALFISSFNGFWDPLKLASHRGKFEVVRLLLDWNTNTARIPQDSVKTSLLYAIEYGFIDIFRCLIEYGAPDADTFTAALDRTVGGHHVAIAAFLIDNGADLNAIYPISQRNSLIKACIGGTPDMVRLLLARGADPNAVDTKGWSPLRAWCRLQQLEVLKALLEYGACTNQHFADNRSRGSTALLKVVKRDKEHSDAKCMQALALLLEYGADPNLPHTDTGETPLMLAALQLRVDLVKLLLEHGADVTQVNSEGRSVLDLLGDEKYGEVRELCTHYIDCNKPGAKLVLK